MSDISRAYHSINIDDRNTWDYWHLIPTARPIVSPPEVKANLVEVPGRYGFIDLSTILTGRTMYGSRQGSWTFIAHPDYHDAEPWNTKYSDIMQYLHGKTHKVILDDDPSYYYEGFLKVNSWQPGANWSQVAIDYTLQPFKKEILTSTEDWLWDPFSFVDGVIRCYKDIEVNSSTITIVTNPGEETVVPTFVIEDMEDPGSSKLYVIYNNTRYELPYGEDTTIPDIKLYDGNATLEFSGVGSGMVRYVVNNTHVSHSITCNSEPYTLEIKTGEEMIIPEFIVAEAGELPNTSTLYVTFNNKRYELPYGETTSISDIKLQGETAIEFSGVGTVSVNFRAGWL